MYKCIDRENRMDCFYEMGGHKAPTYRQLSVRPATSLPTVRLKERHRKRGNSAPKRPKHIERGSDLSTGNTRTRGSISVSHSVSYQKGQHEAMKGSTRLYLLATLCLCHLLLLLLAVSKVLIFSS